MQSVTSLVKQLHARDSRRRFCADDHWLSPRAAVSHETLKISVLLDGDEENESEGILVIYLHFRKIIHLVISILLYHVKKILNEMSGVFKKKSCLFYLH